MQQSKILRGLSKAMALILICTAVPAAALAAQTDEKQTITADHISLDQTHFEYTGNEIIPNVTVRVEDKLLTLDKEYTLDCRDNVDVGTATLVVEGKSNAQPVGYTGKVEIPFSIDPNTAGDSNPDLITIIGTNVLIDGTEFEANGKPIEPAITVTVEGKTLTAGEEYALVYENNIEPGTGSVTVTGVEEQGYTGSVTIHFTITPSQEQPENPEKPEDSTKPEEPTQPEKPTEPEKPSEPENPTEPEKPSEPTEPEKPTEPEDPTEPEETQPRDYKITKGDGASWQKNSGKDLAFTTDGSLADFASLQIDGKTVNSKYYTLSKDSNTVTLKGSLLQGLELGKHTLTICFEDGEAEGSFKITAPADDSNPKTGDDFALHGWTALLFISLTGIIGAAFAYRKKFRK